MLLYVSSLVMMPLLIKNLHWCVLVAGVRTVVIRTLIGGFLAFEGLAVVCMLAYAFLAWPSTRKDWSGTMPAPRKLSNTAMSDIVLPDGAQAEVVAVREVIILPLSFFACCKPYVEE